MRIADFILKSIFKALLLGVVGEVILGMFRLAGAYVRHLPEAIWTLMALMFLLWVLSDAMTKEK